MKQIKKLQRFALILISILVVAGCGTETKNRKIYLPSISGKAGDVLIVIDKEYWESEPGIALRATLASEFPYLPQREPLFTLYTAPKSSFTGGFLVQRNVVVVNINPSLDTAKVVYQEDIWAAPQLVITISAPTKEEAATQILMEKDKMAGAIDQAERNRIIGNAKTYPEFKSRDAVMDQFGGSLWFPKGYTIKKQTKDFIWISYETTYINQGFFAYRFLYKTPKDLELANIIAKRNEILEVNVPGTRDKSYMITSDLLDPSIRWVKYKNREFAEVRGLWELRNDYMGGPFVSHTFLDKNQENIIVLEGFVYAPKFPKRNYLRHVEAILYSFEWAD